MIRSVNNGCIDGAMQMPLLRNRTGSLLIGSIIGMCADLALYYLTLSSGIAPTNAHLLGFLAGVLLTFVIWVRVQNDLMGKSRLLHAFSMYLVIQVLALFIRAGAFAVLMQIVQCAPAISIIPAAFVSSWVALVGSRLTFLDGTCEESRPLLESPRLIISVIAYAVLLRLFCNALAELIFEEAYYWNYAQHLDIGYLDHPPLVGWLIWIFTSLLGDTEFAVRLGALLCWCVTAYYSCKLAAAVFNKEVALKVLLLMAVLPVFFSFGMIMLPDTPLLACWAGALYYLYRLLIENKREAWLAAGIFLGLGLLSKYTICLLGLSACTFILVNSCSRKWLLRPEPYLSALVAILIFSPVIIWNARHGWVSFLFQSAGRINALLDFDLPDLMGTILFLLTPTGTLAAIATMRYRKAILAEKSNKQSKETYSFMLITTMLPLAVFFFISLTRSIKIVWTAPLWLGILPYMAAFTLSGPLKLPGRLASVVARAWPGTIVGALIIYGAVLHYSTLGFPGIPNPRFVPGIGMEHLAAQIESIVDAFHRSTNDKPLVVCMGDNKIASLVAFYRAKLDGKLGRGNKADIISGTTASHFFGGKGLMFSYWHPLEVHKNRVILLVCHKAEQLDRKRVQLRTDPLGDAKEIVVLKNEKISGCYFYRFLKEGMV